MDIGTKPLVEKPSFVAHHRIKDDAWQSLPAHLTGVGTTAANLASKLGLQDMGELLGLLHDLGKC